MEIKKYLQESQPVVFQILKNSFLNQHTSHAYLISGLKGSPILECAIFMAQSFVCSNKDEFNLACGTCVNCLKIANHTYADFKFILGEDLKNDEVYSLQEEFNKSSIENENRKIYIIHLIEKAPIASLNKLLKFVEEPSSNIIAIFTTNSLDLVLQTIVSRCQNINLKEYNTADLISYLMDNQVDKEDAYLISKISNNATKNLELYQSDSYKIIKEVLQNSLHYLSLKDDYFIIDFQVNGLKKLTSNEMIECYLDMLETCLLQALIKKEDEQYELEFFNEEISLIAKKYQYIDQMIFDITTAKIDLLSNANSNLLFDKLLINLLKR